MYSENENQFQLCYGEEKKGSLCACKCSVIRALSKILKLDRHREERGTAIILDPNPEKRLEMPDSSTDSNESSKMRRIMPRKSNKNPDPDHKKGRKYTEETYYREMERTKLKEYKKNRLERLFKKLFKKLKDIQSKFRS